jgi:hypothetical protein
MDVARVPWDIRAVQCGLSWYVYHKVQRVRLR